MCGIDGSYCQRLLAGSPSMSCVPLSYRQVSLYSIQVSLETDVFITYQGSIYKGKKIHQ